MIPFLLFVLCTTFAYADESVKYAAIIFRHGDRTPVNMYPTDPWRNESLWPVRFGELTNIGKKQHYALGKWFRQRYSHLLSDVFDPTEIYVRSTDVDRTLMSAQANLAGIYPPNNKSTWNTEIHWQPIPVHTVPEKEDEILAMKKPCPAFDKELERQTHSKPYKERLSKYQHLMDYLSAYTGMKVKDYYDIDDIYSTLYIESLYNFTLPNWTQSVYPDQMKEPSCYSFTTQTGTPLLARLKVGPLLKHIMNHIKEATSDDSQSHRKVVIYSGHDLTVGSVLNALGLYDGNCPSYTATILIELLTNNNTDGGHNLRISYRNSVDIIEPKVLKIPFCGEVCPVERFRKLYDNLLSVNWEDECKKEHLIFTIQKGPFYHARVNPHLASWPPQLYNVSFCILVKFKEFPALLGGSFIIGLGLFITIYIAHKIHFARVYKQYRKNLAYSSVETAAATPTKTFEA